MIKNKKLSIKWSVFLYLLLFAGVILLILWLCQVAFLDNIYKTVKVSEIKDGALKITANINSDDLGNVIDDVAANEICVTVVDMDSANGIIPLYTHHSIDSCAIHNIDVDSVMNLYRNAEKNDGTSIQRFMYDSQRRRYIGIEGDLFDTSQLDQYRGKLPESIIYTAITSDANDHRLFVMLNSEISPVDATVNTLNKILLSVTVVLIAFALILAMLISHRVTKPIVRLTGEAKKLGEENYEASFDEKAYREVAELSCAFEHAKQELKRVDTLRRELIANISHDLRTPLTMIGGYSEMMRDIPGENNAENAQVIIDETKRLSSLVNDVLDISKLQSGAGNPDIKCFNITDSVKATLDRFSKLCEANGYLIDFYYEGDALVLSDEKRITQVIYNLVTNAMTHTGEAKDVKVRQIIKEKSVRLEVEDSGEGIEPDKLPLIWDRYYKVDKVHKRATVGSGLGLSIVKTIMEQTGGSYGVTSAVGEGSIFFIEIERVIPNEENA